MVEKEQFTVNQSWKGVVRWGGLFLFAAAACLVIFILAVFISGQVLPVPAKEALESPAGPTAIFLIAALGELLLIPGGLGLYFALRDIKKTPMFIATAFWSVAAVLFLVSRGLIISLARISGSYIDASSETVKEAYLASSEHAIETQTIYSGMALILLSVASIIIGFVMLRGTFGRSIAYMAIVAGILSIFAPFAVVLGIPIVISLIGLVLSAVWQLSAGVRLYRI